MEQSEQSIHEHTNEPEGTSANTEEEDLTLTEIDVEEVAIDGICGVY